MISPDDAPYAPTRAIRRGERAIEPRLAGTAGWIAATYGIAPLNLHVDRILPDDRPRLTVIFERQTNAARFNDASGFNFDADKQRAIAGRMAEDWPELASPGALLVVFAAFEPVARSEVNSRVREACGGDLDRRARAEGYWKFVFGFESAVLFAYTHREVQQLEQSYLGSPCVSEYARRLAEVDEFGYFASGPPPVTLDSRERFERDFAGSWMNYWR